MIDLRPKGQTFFNLVILNKKIWNLTSNYLVRLLAHTHTFISSSRKCIVDAPVTISSGVLSGISAFAVNQGWLNTLKIRDFEMGWATDIQRDPGPCIQPRVNGHWPQKWWYSGYAYQTHTSKCIQKCVHDRRTFCCVSHNVISMLRAHSTNIPQLFWLCEKLNTPNFSPMPGW